MGIEQATPNAELPPATDQDRTAGQDQDAPVGLTQAQLNAIIANEKAQVRRSIQSEYGDLDALKAAQAELTQRKQGEMSELEKLQQQLKDMETKQQQALQEAADARLNTIRLRVGQTLGLPPLIAERLHGDDEDAIKADAELILSSWPGRSSTLPDNDATAGGSGSGSGRLPRLSADEIAAARAAGMSDEDYAKLKQELESF